VWDWTRTHLQRPDGLLSSRWRNGGVADPQPAADADLDTAQALLAAARAFHEPALAREGRRIAAAILAQETVQTSLGPVLVAGPWAVRDRVVNPSYFSPSACRALGRATHDMRWSALEFTSYRIVDQLTARGPTVPPDWATVDRRGHASVRSAPSGMAPRFGFEALRIPIRMAASGTDYGRGLAARLWHFFAVLPPETLAAQYTLDGHPIGAGQHPAMLAAAAASGAAAHTDASQALMDRAVAVDQAKPTYYGAAWLALTQLVLDRQLQGGPV
jgi:endoglucanase